MFMPGSLNAGGKMPKLYLGHDSTQAVGLVTAMVDTPGGMMYEARISETSLGNEALVLAADGVLDAVSVGVNPTKFSYDENGTMVISEASWQELSLVPFGAFAGASVDRVAASIHQEQTEVVLNSRNRGSTNGTTIVRTSTQFQIANSRRIYRCNNSRRRRTCRNVRTYSRSSTGHYNW
jgi:HK97 family phage prohead protease